MSEVKSRKSTKGGGQSSVPANDVPNATPATASASARDGDGGLVLTPKAFDVSAWLDVNGWHAWLDAWDQELNSAAGRHPVIELIWSKAGAQLEQASKGKAKRVHVYLGVFTLLSVLTIITLGLEFFSHFIAFVPPLIHTFHAIERARRTKHRSRDEYTFYLTYWVLYAGLTVFESFVLPHSHHSDDGSDDGDGDDDSSGWAASLSTPFHLFHILFLWWCHNTVYCGALVVHRKLIVPASTMLAAYVAKSVAPAAEAKTE